MNPMTAPDSRDSVEKIVADLHEAIEQNCGDNIERRAFRQLADRLQALARGPQQAGGEDGLRCLDCGKAYAGFPLDVVLPDDQWQAIAGGPGGVLCAACIVERGSRLPGVTVAKLYFPDLSDPVAALQAEVARLQRALNFWLPTTAQVDPAFAERVRDDAMLLMGYTGDGDALCYHDQATHPAEAALREAGRDAERYRWLRDNCKREWESDMPHNKGAPSLDIEFEASGHDLDAAIDAAIGGTGDA